MKTYLKFISVSVLGGAISLASYLYFFNNGNESMVYQNPIQLQSFPVNFSPIPQLENVDFTTAAEKTIHTVVHVKNTTMSQGYTSFEDLFFGRPSQRSQIGTGSGVIISADGYIITNNHVIEGAQTIEITTNSNKTFEAELVGTDPITDIALLKVDNDEPFKYTTFGDSDTAKIGEWVLAVGNPFNLTSTVTAGIISAKSRDLSGNNSQSFIQTDAAVNPGNSGGALVNTNGDLIGINTAISSQTGSYIGYSFAVPSNIARKVVEDLMEFGNVQHGILGVVGGELNSMNAKQLGIDQTEGFFVSEVQANSGADKGGIKEGDVITSINGIKISKFSDLKGFLKTKSPNDNVEVTLIRNGSVKTANVILERLNSIRIPKVGLLKEPQSNVLKDYDLNYGLELSTLAEGYKDDWLADGIKEGSIITTINGVKVRSIDDARNALDQYANRIYRIEIVKTNGEKVIYRFQ
jgi:Do/DeqQ family serine protease